MMLKLKPRLLSLVKFIDDNDKIIDVGCDHAYLDIYLAQTGHPNKIYASDVNSNALSSGIENIEKFELTNKIIPMLSYGIEKANECDVDTLVISGMGAKNIVDILNSPNLNRFYKLILQSNNNHAELRRSLTGFGFNIIYEEVIHENDKTYINIVATRDYNIKTYTDKEYEFGPYLITNPINLDYFKELYASYEKILFKSKSDDVRKKLKYLEDIISDLEE